MILITLAFEIFLKNGSTKHVKLLHDIIFDSTFDKTSRDSLQNFTGFAYSNLSEKKKKVDKNFTLSDIISVCISFNLDTSGNKE